MKRLRFARNRLPASADQDQVHHLDPELVGREDLRLRLAERIVRVEKREQLPLGSNMLATIELEVELLVESLARPGPHWTFYLDF